jgi:hypothetical protein
LIHLAISDSHLLCAQWSEKEGQPLLTSLSYKKLPRSLSALNISKTEIISVLNAGLHLIREDVPFEGDKVYVTIPDHYCQSAMVPLESELTENDGWEFAEWTIMQRWANSGQFEFFGRFFERRIKSVYAIRVSTIFTEPIKLAIQELGGEAVWMGTESSVYFGLNPEKGCTVFYPSTNGYQYFQYSQDSIQSGTARFLKDEWKIHPLAGSDVVKDVFKGKLLFSGKLTDKRKANFKGFKIKQMAAFAGLSLERDMVPSGAKEEELHASTAIATGTIKGVALNFFDKPGLQKFEYEKPISVKKKKPKVKESVKKKPKKYKAKKNINFLQPLLSLFFFVTIGTMIAIDQKPELFDPILKYKENFFEKVDKSTQNAGKKEFVEASKISPKNESEYLLKSQSLISISNQIFALSGEYQILFFSISDGRIDLELIGTKLMDAPIDTLGDVLNYSLRQVNGDEMYKHGYLVNYSYSDSIEIESEYSLKKIQSYIEGINHSFVKMMDPIERNDGVQVPIIVRIEGLENINQLLSELSMNGNNVALEKLVYTNNLENINPSAIFYLSLHFLSLSKSQN